MILQQSDGIVYLQFVLRRKRKKNEQLPQNEEKRGLNLSLEQAKYEKTCYIQN